MSREITVARLHEEICKTFSGHIELKGRLNLGKHEFLIARAKDSQGSVLRFAKLEAPSEVIKDHQAWRQWWAKIAVRSGYQLPLIDPKALRTLLKHLEHPRSRFEFIFDTSALIGGTGHWLVRHFGERADLVRTVVTDLEIHDFGHEMKASNDSAFARRASMLAASRFLEHTGHPHPIWRRLDTDEETALFVAKSTQPEKGNSGKSAGRDTLLLRAARRAILDQVPGLYRFFVTEDKNLARAALHDLPRDTVITSYINALPNTDSLYRTPYAWLPINGWAGQAVASNLAAFVWESLCLCAEILLEDQEGRRWTIRAFQPGGNEFPSTWENPQVYVEEQAPPAKINIPPASEPPESADAPGEATEAEEPVSSAKPVSTNPVPLSWPFRKEHAQFLTPQEEGTPNVSAPTVLRAFGELVASQHEGRAADFSGVAAGKGLILLMGFLRLGGFFDFNHHCPLEAGRKLPAMFAENDLDALSHLCTGVSKYKQLCEALRKNERFSLNEANVLLRSSHNLTGLARILGQAVKDGEMLVDGGAYIDEADFSMWFRQRFETYSNASPHREASIAEMARKALDELHLSPVRFGKALEVILKRPDFADLEPGTGGSVESILAERVAKLYPDGTFDEEKVSADGLLHGIRTLKKRLP